MKKINKKLVYAAVGVIAILIATSILGIMNYQQTKKLDELNARIAAMEADRAVTVAHVSDSSEAVAARWSKIAEEQAGLAKKEQANAQAARSEAELQRIYAVEALKKAEKARAEADTSAMLAARMQKEAEAQAQKALMAEAAASRARYLAQAKAMAVKSLELGDDPEQEALIAMQAYKFNTHYGGNRFDNDVYNGLYRALDRSNNHLSRNLYGHDKGATALVTSVKTQELYSAGNDGRILRWVRKGAEWKSDSIMGSRKDYQVHSLDVSPDGKWLVAGVTSKGNPGKGIVELYDLKNPGKVPKKTPGFAEAVTLIYSLKENGAYVLDGADIKFTDFNTVQVVIKPKEKINTLAMSADGKKLAGAGASGALYFWDIANNHAEKIVFQNQVGITSTAFAPDNHRVVIGDQNGLLKIIVEDSDMLPRILTGHKASIDRIIFNHSGTFFATVSRDRTVRIWNMNRLTDVPILLNDEGLTEGTATFTPDDGQLMVSILDNTSLKKPSIRVWPTQVEAMAQALCAGVTRNMIRDEWYNFVGSDLPYERTCENLAPNNK